MNKLIPIFHGHTEGGKIYYVRENTMPDMTTWKKRSQIKEKIIWYLGELTAPVKYNLRYKENL